MIQLQRLFWLSYLFFLALPGARATTNLRLPAIFGDHMVLQADMPVRIWGWAAAGHNVTVGFRDAVYSSTAGPEGKWSVQLGACKSGGPYEMSIGDGEGRTILHDIFVGDVWLASGQSNMEFGIQTDSRAAQGIAGATDSLIRFFYVPMARSAEPLDEIGQAAQEADGKWVVCSPSVMASKWAWHGFSAVGYYFGRELLETLNVPVGIIFSGIGASAAQAYVPQPVLAADTQLNRIYLQPYLNSPRSKEVINSGFSFEKVTRPFLLYNAIIYPLRHISLRGICWYQGEANRKERESYTRLTQVLIQSWREMFGHYDLPFYYVQVAPFFLDKDDPVLADYAFFREAQEKVSALNNTAMITTVDVGEAKNLHPHNKKPIGIRLARTALNRTYGRLDTVWRGPQYHHMEVEGKKIRLFFEPGTTSGGLKTDDGGAPGFFSVAGADQQFYPAEATIEGDQILVWSAKVRRPVAVRYAFTNYAITTLHNGAGWPVIPFRTDNWVEPAPKTN